ncbi:MAG: hypothetical protein A2W11_07670 [Ignavibacteria bacterium RBG_16_35_7]|nr:MAG: hypothetical protein A2W11_07670 [Ignavibacteria bacterium RBG_16_35_7]
MTEISQNINIKAPLNKVFEYTSDYRNWSEFFEGVSNVKPITEIRRGNGAKFVYKVKVMGMSVTVGTELNEFKENEGWRGKSFKGMEHSTQWIFKKSNGDTEFTYILNYDFPWYFGGKLIDKLFARPEWIRIIENSLQKVKRIMEQR